MKEQSTAELESLAYCIVNGGCPKVGDKITVDARLGCEGPNNWSRWTFEATAEQIKAGYEMAAKWEAQIACSGSFGDEAKSRAARSSRFYLATAATF